MTAYYTRYGTEREPNATSDKGKPEYTYTKSCTRCGGAGGSSKWAHTGWTCFDCGGSGKGGLAREKLYTAEALAKLNATKAKRDAKAAAAAEAKAAALKAEREFAWGTYYGANKAAVDNIRHNAEAHRIITDMSERLGRMERLSDKALDFGLSLILAKLAVTDLKAESDYVGTVGKREVFTFTVEKIINLGAFTWGAPVTYLNLGRDAAGNSIVYKGSSDIGGEGETTTVKATVKEHSEYNGERRTVLTRPAVLETTGDCTEVL